MSSLELCAIIKFDSLCLSNLIVFIIFAGTGSFKCTSSQVHWVTQTRKNMTTIVKKFVTHHCICCLYMCSAVCLPLLARSLTVSFPIPALPPVTIAVFPSRRVSEDHVGMKRDLWSETPKAFISDGWMKSYRQTFPPFLVMMYKNLPDCLHFQSKIKLWYPYSKIVFADVEKSQRCGGTGLREKANMTAF